MFGSTLSRALTLATVLSLLLTSVALGDQFQTDDLATGMLYDGSVLTAQHLRRILSLRCGRD